MEVGCEFAISGLGSRELRLPSRDGVVRGGDQFAEQPRHPRGSPVSCREHLAGNRLPVTVNARPLVLSVLRPLRRLVLDEVQEFGGGRGGRVERHQ